MIIPHRHVRSPGICFVPAELCVTRATRVVVVLFLSIGLHYRATRRREFNREIVFAEVIIIPRRGSGSSSDLSCGTTFRGRTLRYSTANLARPRNYYTLPREGTKKLTRPSSAAAKTPRQLRLENWCSYISSHRAIIRAPRRRRALPFGRERAECSAAVTFFRLIITEITTYIC